MSTATQLWTVAQVANLPDPPGGYHELRHGELIKVTFPVRRHLDLQDRIAGLLRAVLGEAYAVRIALPFRAEPEHDLRRADIGVVASERWEQVERWLAGAPELVVEVLSPSNTVMEMLDRQHVCLDGGALEFWVIDRDSQTVDVKQRDGSHGAYRLGQNIPLASFSAGALSVKEIFAV